MKNKPTWAQALEDAENCLIAVNRRGRQLRRGIKIIKAKIAAGEVFIIPAPKKRKPRR